MRSDLEERRYVEGKKEVRMKGLRKNGRKDISSNRMCGYGFRGDQKVHCLLRTFGL